MRDQSIEYRKKRWFSGFTLIELLVVMSIILVLAGLVLKTAKLSQMKSAKGVAAANLEMLRMGFEEYATQFGAVPPGEPDINDEVDISIASTNKWRDVVLVVTNAFPEIHLIDPWGMGYLYQRTAKYNFDLWSLGPDGVNRSEDDIRGRSSF